MPNQFITHFIFYQRERNCVIKCAEIISLMDNAKITELAIRGTRIIIKDAMTMLSEKAETPEWPHVAVSPGEYVVSIMADAGKTKGVRVCHAGAADPRRGKEVGRVSVDHAAVAICDYDALLAAVRSDPDAYSDWTEDDCEAAVWEKNSGVLNFSGVPIAHLKTGVGDGRFPVWELLEGSAVVGMECFFDKGQG
jgi:hypothetical protein